MKFISVYFVSYFLWKEILEVSSTSNYFNDLIKYLKEESKLHQVVFILDNQPNTTDIMKNSLEMALNMHFPSLRIRYTLQNRIASGK